MLDTDSQEVTKGDYQPMYGESFTDEFINSHKDFYEHLIKSIEVLHTPSFFKHGVVSLGMRYSGSNIVFQRLDDTSNPDDPHSINFEIVKVTANIDKTIKNHVARYIDTIYKPSQNLNLAELHEKREKLNSDIAALSGAGLDTSNYLLMKTNMNNEIESCTEKHNIEFRKKRDAQIRFMVEGFQSYFETNYILAEPRIKIHDNINLLRTDPDDINPSTLFDELEAKVNHFDKEKQIVNIYKYNFIKDKDTNFDYEDGNKYILDFLLRLSLGNQKKADELLRVIAIMAFEDRYNLSRPSIIVYGEQGIGKSLLCNILHSYAGTNSSSDVRKGDISGDNKFCSAAFLRLAIIDDTIKSEDKKSSMVEFIKNLTRKPIGNREKKGIDANTAGQRACVFLASNQPPLYIDPSEEAIPNEAFAWCQKYTEFDADKYFRGEGEDCLPAINYKILDHLITKKAGMKHFTELLLNVYKSIRIENKALGRSLPRFGTFITVDSSLSSMYKATALTGNRTEIDNMLTLIMQSSLPEGKKFYGEIGEAIHAFLNKRVFKSMTLIVRELGVKYGTKISTTDIMDYINGKVKKEVCTTRAQNKVADGKGGKCAGFYITEEGLALLKDIYLDLSYTHVTENVAASSCTGYDETLPF
jgi:hypothetical protein